MTDKKHKCSLKWLKAKMYNTNILLCVVFQRGIYFLLSHIINTHHINTLTISNVSSHLKAKFTSSYQGAVPEKKASMIKQVLIMYELIHPLLKHKSH